MKKYKKLSDDEIRELVKENPKAGKLLSSLREHIASDVYMAICPDLKMDVNPSTPNDNEQKV